MTRKTLYAIRVVGTTDRFFSGMYRDSGTTRVDSDGHAKAMLSDFQKADHTIKYMLLYTCVAYKPAITFEIEWVGHHIIDCFIKHGYAVAGQLEVVPFASLR